MKPYPNGRFPVHILAMQHDNNLFRVLKSHPELLSAPSPQDGGRCVIHILASLGYKDFFFKLIVVVIVNNWHIKRCLSVKVM